LSVTRGNSATLAYNLSAKAVRATSRDKITVYSTAIYATDDTTPPSRTTAHAIRGGIRVDLNVSEKLFVFGFTDFEYDEFQDLNLRNVLGGGLGYHVIKTKNTTFDVFGGGDFEQEYFSADAAFPTGLTRKTGEAVLGEEFDTKLNNRATLSEKLSLFPNMSNTGGLSPPVRCNRVDQTQVVASLAGDLQRPLLERPVAGAQEERRAAVDRLAVDIWQGPALDVGHHRVTDRI